MGLLCVKRCARYLGVSREVSYLTLTFKKLIVWLMLVNAQISYLEQYDGMDFPLTKLHCVECSESLGKQNFRRMLLPFLNNELLI